MPDPGGVKNTANSSVKIIVPVTVLCLLVGVLAFLLLADRTPKLDLEILQAKRALWSAKGLGDYDISIRIKVDRQDESSAAVSVRDGKILSQSYNGLARTGKEDSYTIEGLFRTMERELNLASDAEEKSSTILKAEFDDHWGFPVVFKKLTTRQGARSYVIRLAELRSESSGILFPTGQP
ncbi:MAG: DUF6174 domain-containing protein [Planctomycetota bacterium]|jgi:hypothetical protein